MTRHHRRFCSLWFFATMLAIAIVSIGCEPGDGHDHSHDHHSHDHEGHSHHDHNHGHSHDTNDPAVLDIAVIAPAGEEPDGLASLADVEAAGGHVTWRTGTTSPEAIATALSEVSRYCDAVVIELPGDLAKPQSLESAIRDAGLRGVRVIVVGRGLGEPGVDYIAAIVPAESASPDRNALLDAAIDAARRAASPGSDTVESTIEVGSP